MCKNAKKQIFVLGLLPNDTDVRVSSVSYSPVKRFVVPFEYLLLAEKRRIYGLFRHSFYP